jgi:hypothetical protein
MAFNASGECPCHSVISPMTRSGSRERYDFVGLPRNFLFVRLGVIFNRTSRFHDVDSAGTFADGQLRSPRGCIQSAGQVDVGCLRPLSVVRVIADVRKIGGLDQASWLQVGPCPMVEPLRPQVVDVKNAYVHVCHLLICDERLTRTS